MNELRDAHGPRCRRRRRRRVSTYNSHDGSTHARVKTLPCISWQGCAKSPFLFLLKGGSHTRDRFIFAFRVERDCENTAANNIPDAGTFGILRQLLISSGRGLQIRVRGSSRRDSRGFNVDFGCNHVVTNSRTDSRYVSETKTERRFIIDTIVNDISFAIKDVIDEQIESFA